MEPRLSLITLGVADVARARSFYESMGWKASSASTPEVAFLRGRGIVLSLFPREELAKDATVAPGGSGFRGITLAHNVVRKEEVAAILEEAVTAGARIIKPAQDVFWGGHSGYFADPDGHLWEIAWNPHFPLNDRGEVTLPE
jgi:catechol 2,3-dioxygenase-like lactoylglutathione lyase family enzyme